MVCSSQKFLQMFELYVESPCASLDPNSSGEFLMQAANITAFPQMEEVVAVTAKHPYMPWQKRGAMFLQGSRQGRQVSCWHEAPELPLPDQGLWLLRPWWWQSCGSRRLPVVDPLSLLTLSLQRVMGNFSDVTYSSFLILSSPCHPNRLSGMAWISLKFLWFLVSDFGLAICHPGSVSPLSVLRMTEHRITSLDKIINASLSNCQ